MNSDDLGQLIYLVLLLLAVGSWVFMQNRQTLGKTAQQLLIWVLIFYNMKVHAFRIKKNTTIPIYFRFYI